MTIEDCSTCEHHINAFSDSVLCKFNYEIEHRVIDRGIIVLCPRENKSKKPPFTLFGRKK